MDHRDVTSQRDDNLVSGNEPPLAIERSINEVSRVNPFEMRFDGRGAYTRGVEKILNITVAAPRIEESGVRNS